MSRASRSPLGSCWPTSRYAKLPMVNDLAAAADLLAQNTLICAIAGDTDAAEALRERHGEVSLSAPDFTAPHDEFLVLDADSSQSYAINAVVGGADLVIDGPPGTGKSQTIANLIATLSARGKRVLFVAEKRAAIDAVLSRLEKMGLGDLVLDLHDGPGAKGKLAQQFAKALADASSARPVDMAVAQEQLSRRRAMLVRRTEALHEMRAPVGRLGLRAPSRPHRSPDAVHSDLRLSTASARRLGGEAFRAREADLEAYVGMGGLRIHATDSPWLRALDAGTITTPQQASAVMEAMTTFTNHTLPMATQRIEATLSSVGLARPDSVAEWARTLELLHQAAGVLEHFEPAIFDLDLDATLAALAPATAGLRKLVALDVRRRLQVGQEGGHGLREGAASRAPQLHASVSRGRGLAGGLAGGLQRRRGAPAARGPRGGRGHLRPAGGRARPSRAGPRSGRTRGARPREPGGASWGLHRRPRHAVQAARAPPPLERPWSRPDSAHCWSSCGHATSPSTRRWRVWASSGAPRSSTRSASRTPRSAPSTARRTVEPSTSTAGPTMPTSTQRPQRIRRLVAEHVIAARDAYPTESQLVTHEAAKKQQASSRSGCSSNRPPMCSPRSSRAGP